MESRSSSKKSSKKNKLKGEIRVGNGEYRLGKLLGSGSFGVIYEGHNVNTGQIVAVKLEKVSTSPPGHPQLRFERGIYKILANNVGVPSIYFYGKEEQYYVLIMDLLGPSLEDLFNFCNRKFSLKTILMLADQMLQRVELVHQYQFIHRDIKPDNFLIGLFENFNKIFIIDFGLSKRYMNPKTQEHIPFINGKSLTGTARYASINTHLGCEQSRRDDLETLGYVLIYFAKRGKLPWQGLKAKDKNEKYSRIAQVKQQTTIDDLCAKIPAKSAFIKYLQYCRKLEFTEEPNYQYLRGLFYSVAKKYSYTYDQEFDWVLLAKQYARQKEEQQQQQQQQTQLSQQGQSSSQQMQSHDRKMSLSRRAQLSHENSGHMPISPYGDPNSQQLQPQSASHLYATNQYGQQGNVQQAQAPPMAQYQQQGHGTQSTQQAQAQYQAAPQYQQMAMNQHQQMHYGNNNGNYNGNGNNGNNGNNNVNHNNNNNSNNNNNNNNNGAPYMAMQQMAPNVRMYNQIPNYNYYGNYGNMNYNISVAGPPPPPQYDQTQQVHVSQQQAPPQHMYHASQQHLQHPQMMQHDNYLGVNGNNQYYYSHQQQHSSISKDVQPRASVSGSHLFSNSIGNNEQVSPST